MIVGAHATRFASPGFGMASGSPEAPGATSPMGFPATLSEQHLEEENIT